MPITPAYDLGGFGRLADVKFKKRAESREERRLGMQEEESAQRLKIGSLQLQQTEANLQKIKRQADLKAGLGKALSNIPEGENQFTTVYNYLMMQGEPEMAQKYMKSESDRIDQVFKMDPEEATNRFNQTIGKAMRTTVKYREDKKYGGVFEAIDEKTGRLTYLQKTDKGFEPIKGYRPLKKEEKKAPIDINLESIQTKIQAQEGAKEYAFWTGTKARGKAFDIARSEVGESWPDLSKAEQTVETKKIMDRQLKSIDQNIQYGEQDGVVGWYVPDDAGNMQLIQTWTD
jgi:hypothetical protein